MTTTGHTIAAGGAAAPDWANGLSFRNLSMVFPDGTHAVDNVSFDVRPGEFVAVVGPSEIGRAHV